jgi:hypothetical protein
LAEFGSFAMNPGPNQVPAGWLDSPADLGLDPTPKTTIGVTQEKKPNILPRVLKEIFKTKDQSCPMLQLYHQAIWAKCVHGIPRVPRSADEQNLIQRDAAGTATPCISPELQERPCGGREDTLSMISCCQHQTESGENK